MASNRLDEYLSSIHTVVNFVSNSSQPTNARSMLLKDTFKCILIGSMLSWAVRFTRGKCHYIKHVKSIGFGGVFGLGYSFYFTNQKVETWMAREELGLSILEEDDY